MLLGVGCFVLVYGDCWIITLIVGLNLDCLSPLLLLALSCLVFCLVTSVCGVRLFALGVYCVDCVVLCCCLICGYDLFCCVLLFL